MICHYHSRLTAQHSGAPIRYNGTHIAHRRRRLGMGDMRYYLRTVRP